jgi:H-type lectin domain
MPVTADTDSTHPHSTVRVNISADKITTDGFDALMTTWADSIVNAVAYSWIALPKSAQVR